MASAGGLFPMPIAPVYAASKVLPSPASCSDLFDDFAVTVPQVGPFKEMLPGALRCVEGMSAALNQDGFRVSTDDGVQAGLVHFTRSISGSLAKSGVRLCCLCPQPVDTPMVSTMQSLGLPMPETGASLLSPRRVGYWGCSPCPTLKYLNGDISTSSEELPGAILVWAWTRQRLNMVPFCELEQPRQLVREY